MRKHIIFVLKSIALIFILGICIKFVYWIITPKLFYQEMLQTTLSYTNFYDMKENTVDVLFLGSSLAATSFIPQELYNRYGITSYNLSSEKQSPVISYFWLKEALGYQNPKVLVLDTCYFFYNNDDPLNTEEIYIRRALDYMQWSSVKREAIKTICGLDENQSVSDYYFPNIRYHTRWKELTEEDFLYSVIPDEYALMGYAPLAGCSGDDSYSPYNAEMPASGTDMHPLMKAYLDKIAELCNQEEISLVLTNVPQQGADMGRFYTMQKYADEHELQFLDFNEINIYEGTEFDVISDSYDGAHQNLWGAKKITNYIGDVLVSQYNIGGNYDEQWEKTKEPYSDLEKDCELQRITNICEYIPELKTDRYSIFISAKGDVESCLNEEAILKLRELGLEVNLQTDPSKENFYCYYAVLSEGQTEEYIGYDERTHRSSVRNGEVPYDITGAGSIIIDGAEESMQRDGINIVVYNNKMRKVIDSVSFDASTGANMMRR